MRELMALVLAVVLAAPGCASAARRTTGPGFPGQRPLDKMDRRLMTDYIQQLPVGSKVKVTLDSGRVLHGTLLKRDADPIVLQLRTRVPEPPVTVDIGQIAALELESGETSVGRVVAISVAAGAAATFGVLLLLAAIFASAD